MGKSQDLAKLHATPKEFVQKLNNTDFDARDMQVESTPENLQKGIAAIYEEAEARGASHAVVPVGGTKDTPLFFKNVETQANKRLRYALMKNALLNRCELTKSSVNVGSNVYGYDLRAPSLHLIPWLSPVRDVTPRAQHAQPANAANWKTISASSFSTGGFRADPWIREGGRAPQFSFSATTNTAPYITFGTDGSDTYEAQSAGQGFEDPLSTAHFLGLENLMQMEEDALLGGNKTLKLGTANTPTISSTTPTVAGATINGTFYVAVVGLTYAGYRNQSATAGLVQQMTISPPDGTTQTTNGGMGIASAASSSQAVSTGAALNVSVVPKVGEMAYAWYLGTATGTLYLQTITTNPTVQFTKYTASGQLKSALAAVDYSVNDGTTGGNNDQVTAYDGFLTQILNASQLSAPNSYYSNLAGATITASGRGSVEEIDTAFRYLWDNFRTTVDRIYVNSQQLIDITTACLNNASGPLVRYEMSGDGDHYDMTASGTISYYFNPFVDGGSKIPIIVHPFLPSGTIFLQGLRLPAYFKKSNMQSTAEVICRRDYYGVDWAPRTRQYEFGTYCEAVLAVYAPFAFGIITGIASGVGGL